MIGAEFPIQFKPFQPTTTASGGTVQGYGDPIPDFAEVKDVTWTKEAQTTGIYQANLKKFKVDYRPSLAITDKWLIVFEGIEYTILTIARENNLKFRYVITAKAKI